jgi:tetratricopeptide (TPR) repeat protein
MSTAAAVLLSALPAVASPPPPPPPPPPGGSATADVDALNAEAVGKFKNKEYDAAIALFEQAYALSPEPNYLFNIGRVYEEKGDFQRAIDHYERFVKAPEVELRARDLALERLRVLRAIMAETKVEDPAAPDPAPDEPTGFVLDAPPPTPSRQMPPARVAGITLLGIGAVAMGTGGGLGGAALARQRDLEDTQGLEARNDLIRRGETFAKAADGLLIAGGILAATGLVLTLTSLRKPRGAHARQRRSSERSARILPTLRPGEVGLGVISRF